jgi:MerR family transcriptional regulator, copper efflux regulator
MTTTEQGITQPGTTQSGPTLAREKADAHMQIGHVAERTELSIRTLRHYDEVGLVTPSARSTGGYRLYTNRDVDRLRTIRRMKPLGFTLEEMRRLLDSLDILSNHAANAGQRREATAFVTQCLGRADESCKTIEQQLAYAQEFRGLLATRIDRPLDS